MSIISLLSSQLDNKSETEEEIIEFMIEMLLKSKSKYTTRIISLFVLTVSALIFCALAMS